MPGFDDIKNSNDVKEEAPRRDSRRDSNSDRVTEAAEDNRATSQSLMRNAGRRLLITQSNQYLDQVDKGVREVLDNLHEVKDLIEVVKVTTAALRYPAVAICQKRVIKNKTVVSYFMFPVQDRSTPLTNKSNNRDGRRDVPAVPTDVIDPKFYNGVEDQVRDYYRIGEDDTVICAGVQILGELFKLDYKDNMEGYLKLIEAAVGHTDAALDEHAGVFGATIRASSMGTNTSLVGRIDYSPSINTDLSGNPIRSDLNLTIREQKNRRDRNNRDDSYNGDAGLDQTIIGIDAAINFIFTDTDDENRGRRDDPQKFLPEIRITNVENRLSPTLGNMMFAISHIAALAQGERWVNAHAPNLVRNYPGRNLGGLYAEQPERDDPAAPVDLSEATLDEVFDMAKYCCQKNVLITLMASESSENSRLFDKLFVLADSDIGSDEYNEVYDLLMDELEEMLGEPLDWSSREPIFANDQLHRNLLGYFPVDNEILSTEDIDYLSLVNTGNGLKPLATAQEWDSSYGISDYNEGTATRARIIQEETDGMTKFTGAQTTLSISMTFLNVFNSALIRAGLGIEVEDNSGSSDRRVRRPLSGFNNFAGRSEGYRRRSDRRDDRRGGRSRNGRSSRR